MEPVVSVIIPVYNKEKYLNSCLESVVGQTLQDIEILLINDGSVDGSAQICDEWAKKDIRIRVIHKQNEGAGCTRNKGLELAKGKYVSFVDADDYIDTRLYEIAIQKMEQADVCYFGRNIVSNGKVLEHSVELDEQQVYQGEQIRKDFINFFLGNLPSNEYERHFVTGSVCCALFNREFLKRNQITFPDKQIKYSEDLFLNLELCRYAQKIIVIPDMLYFNNVMRDSKSRKYAKDRFTVYKLIYEKLLEYLPICADEEDAMERIRFRHALYTCKCVKAEVRYRKTNGFFAAYKNIRAICRDELTRSVIKQMIQPGFHSKRNMLLRCIYHRFALIIMFYYIKN